MWTPSLKSRRTCEVRSEYSSVVATISPSTIMGRMGQTGLDDEQRW